MKKLLFYILLLPLFSISQEAEWFPIPSDQVSYFKGYIDIHTMKIDSIIENDSALIYYNLRSPVPIGGDDEYVYYDPLSSWMGKYIVVQDEVVTFHSTYDVKPMPVYYNRETSEPWVYFEFEDGSYIEAHIDGFGEQEILDGIVDSVKFILFNEFDKLGNKRDSYVEDTMIISKNYGFVKVFSMSIYGLELQETNYGFENKLSEYFNSYQVGNQLHFESNNKSVTPFKSQIKDKQEGNYFIDYNIGYCYENGYLTDETERFYPNVYPGQSILFDSQENPQGIYRVFETSHWNGYDEVLMQFYNQYTIGEYNGVSVWVYESSGGNCIYPPIYRVNHLFWAEYESCPDTDFIIQYVQTDNFEYGEPYNFECATGVDSPNSSNTSFSPNPSTGMVNITSSKKIEEVKVFHLNGQLVKTVNEVIGGKLDLSDLGNGVYLLEITTHNHQINHQKIVINKN